MQHESPPRLTPLPPETLPPAQLRDCCPLCCCCSCQTQQRAAAQQPQAQASAQLRQLLLLQFLLTHFIGIDCTHARHPPQDMKSHEPRAWVVDQQWRQQKQQQQQQKQQQQPQQPKQQQQKQRQQGQQR
ncbi:hypothetical protein ACSSS7_004591 [Eimeria intestinalis]